jgi:hypothetical protein
MLRVTLEWNAVLTLENPDRAGQLSLAKLIELHGTAIDLGIVTTAASENNPSQAFPRTAFEFEQRLTKNNIDHLTLVLQPAVNDLTYIGLCAWASSNYEALAQHIWTIIPPKHLPWDRKTFALQEGIDPNKSTWSPEFRKWRNKWCDVNSIYTHIWHERDVFVTGDEKNFKHDRRDRLKAIGIGEVFSYDDALDYCLRQV